ncbi:MAG: OB-fold nucleic acid binding domain-containing protein [Nanoarchaeota archaeon]
MKNKFTKNNNKNKDNRRPSLDIQAELEIVQISDVAGSSSGRVVTLMGSVERIVQTGGPTVFYIADGTGTLALKGFEGAGTRAYPEIEEGDVIKATVELGEYKDELEGEILKAKKIVGQEHDEYLVMLSELERKRAQVTPPQFLIKSHILDKLKDRFIKAATEIRLAIIQNRPIIVRHHNDTDGYSSGYALERAILPLIKKQHTSEKAAWEFYTRAPCAAPFYDIEDSIRDTSHSLSNAAKFSNKMPLVIIADNGGGQEDLMGIKQGKVHGLDFIVVDHHYFDADVISSEVLVNINPFLVGEDGSHYSAGMLCAELGRFINLVDGMEPIAAMAGLADRIANPSAIEAYLKLAHEKGYTKQLLNDIATVIDFISSKLRFMEAREYIEVLFGEPREQQKKLVALMTPYIRNLEAKGLALAKSSAVIETHNKVTLQWLVIDEAFPRGFYPKPGKCTGILHDNLKESGTQRIVTIGLMNDAITIRATDEANFSVHKLLEFLSKELPESFVEGGGHKNAGAIKFVPKKKEEIKDLVRKFIKKI